MDNIRLRIENILHSKLVRAALMFTVSAALLLGLTGASVSKYSVLISDETTKTIVFTSKSEPVEILKDEGIVLAPYDEIEFSSFEDNKAELVIKRAHNVKVTADNLTKNIYVTDGTVEEALQKLNVSVDDDDLINISLDEEVRADVDVTINRVEYRTVEETEEIPFDVFSYYTSSMNNGEVKVLSEGTNGLKTTFVAQTLIDGVVVEAEEIGSETVEPITQYVMTGDSSAPATTLIPSEEIELDENGNPINYITKYTGKATAYSALGKRTSLVPGCVAMNLSLVPRGTRVYIKTPSGSYIYGYGEVRDTGEALVDNIILVDLFFNTYAESCRFGAKTVDVYILP